MSDELWRCGASELAARIASREVSSVEVVDAHLARIEAVNPSVHAVVEVLADRARDSAAAADRALAAGGPRGPLHGVPVTVKTNIDLAGSATTWGLPALAGAVVPVDAPVVERAVAAGAIPIARTNCPDLALRVHTESGLYGLTRNPWDPARTCGGSSGGEAVALATGMTPLGLGTDIGGSLRNPTSCCGTASIKPSAGLVPNAGLVPSPDGPFAFQAFDVHGPMARTVADVRLALGVLAGRHRRDPFSVPVALGAGDPPAGRPRRVAVLAEPPGGSTHAGVSAVVRSAAERLAAGGYELVEAAPPRFEEAVGVWSLLLGSDVRALMPMVGPLLSADATAFLEQWFVTLPTPGVEEYAQAVVARQSILRDWALWFAEVDLVLTPTWTQPPFPVGRDLAADGAAFVLELIRCVLPANLLGLPSACVPAGEVDGLPVGVLLTGDRFADLTCLDAAAVVEASRPAVTPIDPRT